MAWSDGVTDAKRTVVITDDKTLVAKFIPITPADKSDGKLPGKFSVSATTKVSFSMGNLQYQASTNTWRFAENQYDVASGDLEYSATSTDWIDRFGWGASGYNEKYPYMNSESSSDYGDGIYDIIGTDYDWGQYNVISNGGDKKAMWHTLYFDEWDYLFSRRENAANLRSMAIVNGVSGYIILPDDWALPYGVIFQPNSKDNTDNVYDKNMWMKMEASGAVFFPQGLDYWTSTAAGNKGATSVVFSDIVDYEDCDRSKKLRVRLAAE